MNRLLVGTAAGLALSASVTIATGITQQPGQPPAAAATAASPQVLLPDRAASPKVALTLDQLDAQAGRSRLLISSPKFKASTRWTVAKQIQRSSGKFTTIAIYRRVRSGTTFANTPGAKYRFFVRIPKSGKRVYSQAFWAGVPQATPTSPGVPGTQPNHSGSLPGASYPSTDPNGSGNSTDPSQPAPTATATVRLSPNTADESVNPGDRDSVRRAWAAWQAQLAGGTAPVADTTNCTSIAPDAAYRANAISHINWYRNLAGLWDVVESPTWEPNARAAALMMLATGQLSHTPSTSFKCYTAQGAAGANTSNLALGVAGPEATDAYIDDFGANNLRVGHRRWLLYPRLAAVASGDVQTASGGRANALHLVGLGQSESFGPRQPIAGVAWPNIGYVPRGVVPSSRRWSFSAPADLSAATVSVVSGGTPVPISVISVGPGAGDSSIVWTMPESASGSAGMADTTYTVTIGGARVPATGTAPETLTTYIYNVTVIDPAS